MFVTHHVLAGVSIGAALHRRPVAAFAAGFASHLAMDMLPHWGADKRQPDWKAQFLRAAYRDGIAGLAVMGAATAVADPSVRVAVVAGMVGAAVPDLDKPFDHFFGICPFPRWFQDFHVRIQRESPEWLGRELTMGSGLLALAARSLRPRRPETAR